MHCSTWFVSYDKQDWVSDWIFTDWLFRWIKHHHVTMQMSAGLRPTTASLNLLSGIMHESCLLNSSRAVACDRWAVILKCPHFRRKYNTKYIFIFSILNKCIKWKFAFLVIQMPHAHAHMHARMHAHVHTRAHTHTHTHTHRTIQHNRGKSIQIKRSKTPLLRLIKCTVITHITTLHRLSIHSQNN